MRTTIVIIAIAGLLSIALDRAHEVDPVPGGMLLSSPLSESMIPAVEEVALNAGENDGADRSIPHLKDIQAVADLGSLLLIGVALAGLIGAPKRENRKARAARRIT